MMSIRSLFLFIGALGLSRAQTCNETTESTFEIDFAITREFHYFSWYLDFNFSTIRDEFYNSSDKVPTNTTIHCIPKDECVALRVTELHPNQYTIRLDGQAINPGPSFPYFDEHHTFSTTELGDCIPTCGEGEALFEVATLTGTEELSLDWRLEDSTTRQVLAECTPRWFPYCDLKWWRLYHSRHCLPVDSCYRFVVGDDLWFPSFRKEYEQPVFNITFDGEDIASFKDFPFNTVDVGHGCSAPCNGSESLLEFFLWRSVFDDTVPDISWSFKDGEDMLLEGAIAGNDTRLQYSHECVPSDACISFSASVPETKTVLEFKEWNHTYYEYGPYRLSLDGVIFLETEYDFGGFGDSREFSETAVVGECTTAALCDTETESLLDLRFEPSGERSFNLDWYVQYVDEELKLSKGNLASAWNTWRGVIPDLSYRTCQCIPKTNCTSFSIYGYYTIDNLDEFNYTIDNVDEFNYSIEFNYNVEFKYKLFVAGNKVDSRDCTGSKCYGVGEIVTHLGGENCPTSSDLSTGAIVGIAVGSVTGFAVLALLAFKLIHRRKPPTTIPSVTGTIV